MEILGDHIDVVMVIFDPLRGGRADRGELCPADLARVVVKLVENFEKRIHPVRTGENDPFVAVCILHQFGEFAQIGSRFAPDQRQFVDIRSEIAQGAGQLPRLRPAARDDNTASEKRTSRGPGKLLRKFDHIAKYYNGGRQHTGLAHLVGNVC